MEQPDNNLLKTVADSLERSKVKYRLGDCLSVTYLVSNPRLKRWIGQSLSVDIVDMESYWMTKVASEYGIPAIALRSVTDTVDEELLPFVAQAVEGNGKGNWLKALKYAAANPFRIKALRRLALQANRAQNSLSQAVPGILVGLREVEVAATGV